MPTEEAADCRSTFGGVKVPYVETCPNLSVLDVFEMEGAGRPVWGEELNDDTWPVRTVHLFVTFLAEIPLGRVTGISV